MRMHRRIISAACAALVAALVVVAPAWASTLSIQLPANPEISKPINVVYSGVADSPGTTDVTGTLNLNEGVEMIMPGDNTSVSVELIAPVALEKGARFAIREGGRTVGAGVVAKITD